MNVNDSERILTMLSDIGYLPVTAPADADMILLNTCSVRSGAEEKVYRRLENLAALKRTSKHLIIGVGGCVAQQEGDALLEKLPCLDLVFGTHNLHLLNDMVRAAERGERRSETAFIDNTQRLDLFPPVKGAAQVSSFVTIMQGCDNYCSYCIVPYVRGQEISRRSSEILREVQQLAADGVREITLLGQNVNSYGLKSADEPSFAELIRQVAAVDGILRIRFYTSHPKDMSEDLIACYREIPALCGQVHLPAQSGSTTVLERMNRGYTRGEYLEKIRALKSACPGIAISGDMIVGFPGETEQEFGETLSLMEEVRFIDLFSFAYSPRPGTGAAALNEELSREAKQRRLERLLTLQKQITLELGREYLGTTQTVLVEGEGKRPGQVSGKADSGRTVNFTGDKCLIGSLVNVRITQAFQNSLLGELI
jgi:tRNA-2-methylthio-N6-dimethylallyladenosine synthase